MKTKLETFVWYATDPQDGELILALEPGNNYKHGHIYCIRMVCERLPRWDIVRRFEAQLGPCGLVPKEYWQEAGIAVLASMNVRIIALMCNGDGPDLTKRMDQQVVAWILERWQAARAGQPAPGTPP